MGLIMTVIIMICINYYKICKNENLIPYSRQYIDAKDIEAVTKVLKSDFLTSGPQVNNFEKK